MAIDNIETLRLALWSLIAFVALAVVLGWAQTRQEPARQDFPYATPFTLTNQNGEAVTEKNFLGKPSLWFFGFTHCPDVCPTALADMRILLEALGKDADKINVVFVSVDPARDTPEVMKEYVAYFDPRIVGLSGPQSEVQSMTKARYIYFEKMPAKDGNYDMEHTAGVQMVDANGAFVGTLDSHEQPKVRLEKVKNLINLKVSP